MTHDSPRHASWAATNDSDASDDVELLLLLSDDQNGRILAEKLSPYYEVTTSRASLTTDGFDLCLLDRDSLERHREELVAITRAEEPVFLPYLLVVDRDVDGLDPSVLELVDEVITVPIALAELGPRIKSLLRHRTLSKQVSERDHLGEMAAILSHDLRNPLNVARGTLELGRQDDSDGSDPDEHFQTTADALERMNTLIEDLLSFAKQEYASPDPEPVGVAAAASRAWDHSETGDAELVVDVSDDVAVVADPSRLQELFSNLFRNASEHNDGVVTVTVGTTDSGFAVADDGVGIDESDRQAIFETGYSTNDDGTGFGLPIVTRIANAHSWDVGVTESASGGARFEFTGVQFHDGSTFQSGGGGHSP